MSRSCAAPHGWLRPIRTLRELEQMRPDLARQDLATAAIARDVELDIPMAEAARDVMRGSRWRTSPGCWLEGRPRPGSSVTFR
jgi:hypothetical protein